ncbi:MAG: hypothetical protein QOF89_1538 [Acidobacteriota bacterium]|jgi:hypothetical protein|nr:hypothetical protein [Acidobacteriota bacterium]
MAAGQLNRLLGENTVQFHLQHPLPDLKSTVTRPSLPNRSALDSTGGTPNQKAERLANRVAFYHFVEPDAAKGRRAAQDTVGFFKDQLTTGHQCVGNGDEALTPSHGPVWLRAIMSLRITSQALARGSRTAPYVELETRVLEWIRHHTSLNRLGEVLGGVHQGKVLLPGARTDTALCFVGGAGGPDGKYPADPLTDQVTNVVHQLIANGAVAWKLGRDFFKLRQTAQDLAGAALARSIVDTKIGFGAANQPQLPVLRSRLLVYRLPDGHWGTFPDLMPCALDPGYHAWARYSLGELCRSKAPAMNSPFPGPLPEPVEVKAAPRGTAACNASQRPGGGPPEPA